LLALSGLICFLLNDDLCVLLLSVFNQGRDIFVVLHFVDHFVEIGVLPVVDGVVGLGLVDGLLGFF